MHRRLICIYLSQYIIFLAELLELAFSKQNKCQVELPVYTEEIHKRSIWLLILLAAHACLCDATPFDIFPDTKVKLCFGHSFPI